MALDKEELKKLLKEKGVRFLDDFNAFMLEISKEVVETLLEGELTDHLGYEKHDQKAKGTGNARNGFTSKTFKSKFGEIGLEVPRDRQSDFETSSSPPSSIPTEIPALVFTTNPIESPNRKIKKAARKKAIFPIDQPVILAIEAALKKSAFRHREWAVIYSQLMIYLGDRLADLAQMRKRSLQRKACTPRSGADRACGPRPRSQGGKGDARPSAWRAISVALGLLMITGFLARPASSHGQESEPAFPQESVWASGIGNGFRRGLFQVGGMAGAGFGVRAFGGTLDHDLTLGSIDIGWVITDVMASDRWYRGTLEFLIGLFGGWQFKPDTRYLACLTPCLRYSWVTDSRWVPFIEGGAGISSTNIDGPDLTGHFQFNVQGGAGTRYFLTGRTALTFQYRWLHVSNLGLREPNNGINTQMFYIGVCSFF